MAAMTTLREGEREAVEPLHENAASVLRCVAFLLFPLYQLSLSVRPVTTVGVTYLVISTTASPRPTTLES